MQKPAPEKIATGLGIKWFYIPCKKIILVKIIFSYPPILPKAFQNVACQWKLLKLLFEALVVRIYIRRDKNVELGAIIPLLVFQLICCFLMKSLGLLWLNLLLSENVFPKKRTRTVPIPLVFKWIAFCLKLI